jgi:hypothetical protein
MKFKNLFAPTWVLLIPVVLIVPGTGRKSWLNPSDDIQTDKIHALFWDEIFNTERRIFNS